MATATFSSSNVSWPLVLKANGIDPAKVDLLKADPGALAPMLAAGKVAATINWVTVAPAFVKPLAETGKKLKVIAWSDHGFDGYGLSVFASEKILTSAPRNREEIHARLHESDRRSDRRSDGCGQGLEGDGARGRCRSRARPVCGVDPLIVNSISKKDGEGDFEKALLAKTWKWTAEAQNMPLDKMDPETAVDRSFLPK